MNDEHPPADPGTDEPAADEPAAEAPEPENSPPETPQAEPDQTHVARELKHNSPLIACRFDPSGRFVFFGAQDSRVWRWELDGDGKTELAGHESWVRALAFDHSGQTLVTGGYDGRLVWWPLDAEQPEPLRTVEAHDGWVRAVAVSPDGTLLASVGNDHLVKLWSMEDGQPVGELAGHESHIYNVVFHPDGSRLVTGDLKMNLIDWQLDSGELLRTLTVPELHKYDTTFRADIGGPRGMTFSPDGTRLVCSGMTNVSNAFAGVGNPAVVVLDWESGEQQMQHESKGKLRGVAWGVAAHPQQFLVGLSGGGGGGFLLFWKHDEKEDFHRLKLPNTARDLSLSPDRLELATAHYDGHVRISRMTAKE